MKTYTVETNDGDYYSRYILEFATGCKDEALAKGKELSEKKTDDRPNANFEFDEVLVEEWENGEHKEIWLWDFDSRRAEG